MSGKKDTTQIFFKLSIVDIFRTNLFYYLINSLNPGFIIHKIVYSLKNANKVYFIIYIWLFYS